MPTPRGYRMIQRHARNKTLAAFGLATEMAFYAILLAIGGFALNSYTLTGLALGTLVFMFLAWRTANWYIEGRQYLLGQRYDEHQANMQTPEQRRKGFRIV